MVWDLTKADYIFTPNILKISQQNGCWVPACSRNTLTTTYLETLDRIYKCGCTEFFNRIVSESVNHVSFGTHMLHTDTTNFSLHGAYNNPDPDHNSIEITYGHPKDNRWDLKRFVKHGPISKESHFL